MRDFKCTQYTIEGKKCDSQCSECEKLEEGQQWVSYDGYVGWTAWKYSREEANKLPIIDHEDLVKFDE
jgi:hypothetical protein